MSYCLVTGGAGFIGSHIIQNFIDKKLDFIVIDNLNNSTLKNINNLESFYKKKVLFKKIDIRDYASLDKLFKKYAIDSVIHLAGLKSIQESIQDPKLYYNNNVEGSKILLEILKQNNCKKIIFSSSASVYGNPLYNPIDESHPTNPLNPYASSKLIIENLIKKISDYDNKFSSVILRYFNPIGSFKGIIGENFDKSATNVMPALISAGKKWKKKFTIYGDDFDTPDGFAIRDYFHVCDLADAHLKSLKFLDKNYGCHIFNIGSTTGYSVKELYETFKYSNEINFPCFISKRREGDLGIIIADASKIKKVLKWKTNYSLNSMCKDSWDFVKNE